MENTGTLPRSTSLSLSLSLIFRMNRVTGQMILFKICSHQFQVLVVSVTLEKVGKDGVLATFLTP
jgi:hypothetical protein